MPVKGGRGWQPAAVFDYDGTTGSVTLYSPRPINGTSTPASTMAGYNTTLPREEVERLIGRDSNGRPIYEPYSGSAEEEVAPAAAPETASPSASPTAQEVQNEAPEEPSEAPEVSETPAPSDELAPAEAPVAPSVAPAEPEEVAEAPETATSGEAAARAEAPEVAPAEAPMPMQRVTKTVDGRNETWNEPDFLAVDPVRSHRYIYNESGLTPEEATEFVTTNHRAATDALTRHEKAAPKMVPQMELYRRRKAEWMAAGERLRGEVDYWDRVRAEQARVVAASQGEETPQAPASARGGGESEIARTNRGNQEKANDDGREIVGRPLTPHEEQNFIAYMEEHADVAPEIPLTPKNWAKEFGVDGIINTPIGKVKQGDNQYLKIAQQGQKGKLGMVRPTLEYPSVIIEEYRPAKDGNQERDSSYVFIRTFLKKDGSRYYHFASITVRKDGKEVVISSEERSKNRISKLLQQGKVAWIDKEFSLHPISQIEESVPLNDSNRPTSTDSQPALLGINSSERIPQKTSPVGGASYGKNAKEVYNRHTTEKPTAESVEASQGSEQSGTTESSRMNAPTPSDRKDTSLQSNKQIKGQGSSGQRKGAPDEDGEDEDGDVRYRTSEEIDLQYPEKSKLLELIENKQSAEQILTPTSGTKPTIRSERKINELIRLLQVEDEGQAHMRVGEIEALDERFNRELEMYANGELPAGHRFELGIPSPYLLSAGFPLLPITLRASLLKLKSGMGRYQFEAADLRGLVHAIQGPIATFSYSKDNVRNLIVDVTHDNKHFLVGVTLNYKVGEIEINSVSGLFPKDDLEWLKWIQDGKAIRIDQKEKVQAIIDIQRTTNTVESERIGLNLDSVAKVVNSFENPPLEGPENAGYMGATSDEAMIAYAGRLAERLNTPVRIVSDPGEISHKCYVINLSAVIYSTFVL